MTEAQIKAMTAEYEAKLRRMAAEAKDNNYGIWDIEDMYLREFDGGAEKHFAEIVEGYAKAKDKKKFVQNVKPHSGFANFARKLSTV